MIREIGISALSIAVCLAAPAGFGLSSVYAGEAMKTDPQARQSEFVYNDDWAIVSAPPPPGPYNSVNLDPRIPGQEDNVRPDVSLRGPPAINADRIIDDMAANPPAAGQPVIESRPPARAARQAPYSTPPVYGYGRMPARMQPHPWSAIPPPLNYPPTGWGQAPGAIEEEVPPPPAYDRMTRPPPGPFGYRRGSY